MKYVVVQWKTQANGQYRDEMRVVCSNHPRFVDGSRFDYGFMSISGREGYTVTVVPSEESLDLEHWKDGELVEGDDNES